MEEVQLPPPYKLYDNPPSYETVINLSPETPVETSVETPVEINTETPSNKDFISIWCIIISFIVLSCLWTSWKYSDNSFFLSFAVIYTFLFGIYLIILTFCLLSCSFFSGY